MKRITVHVDEVHLIALQQLGAGDERTVAFLIRRAIRKYVAGELETSSHTPSHPVTPSKAEQALSP